jgi:hypothetical protein
MKRISFLILMIILLLTPITIKAEQIEPIDIDNLQIYDIEYNLNDEHTGYISTCPENIKNIVTDNIYEKINDGNYWERDMDLY